MICLERQDSKFVNHGVERYYPDSDISSFTSVYSVYNFPVSEFGREVKET